jgi:hypothetical protein
MNIHLMMAYIIFCSVPLVMAISIALRRRNVRDDIHRLQEALEERIAPGEKEGSGF